MTLAFEFERYFNICSVYTPAWLFNGQRIAYANDARSGILGSAFSPPSAVKQ